MTATLCIDSSLSCTGMSLRSLFVLVGFLMETQPLDCYLKKKKKTEKKKENNQGKQEN